MVKDQLSYSYAFGKEKFFCMCYNLLHANAQIVHYEQNFSCSLIRDQSQMKWHWHAQKWHEPYIPSHSHMRVCVAGGRRGVQVRMYFSFFVLVSSHCLEGSSRSSPCDTNQPSPFSHVQAPFSLLSLTVHFLRPGSGEASCSAVARSENVWSPEAWDLLMVLALLYSAWAAMRA